VGVGADEETRIVAARKVAQNLRDALRGQLTRSAGAGSIVDQSLFAAEKQHGTPSFRRRREVKNSRPPDGTRHASRFLFQLRADRLHNPLLVGELFRFQLRVQQLAVDGQLETAST
jgi:hypothetical protein